MHFKVVSNETSGWILTILRANRYVKIVLTTFWGKVVRIQMTPPCRSYMYNGSKPIRVMKPYDHDCYLSDSSRLLKT
jgi:hypothetical protein